MLVLYLIPTFSFTIWFLSQILTGLCQNAKPGSLGRTKDILLDSQMSYNENIKDKHQGLAIILEVNQYGLKQWQLS
jgi:hypothetical protein